MATMTRLLLLIKSLSIVSKISVSAEDDLDMKFDLRGLNRKSCSSSQCFCSPPLFPDSVSCTGHDLLVIPNDLPPMITKLGLQDNQIHSVDNILGHYPKLTHLSLAGNRVSQIQGGSFRNSAQLSFLDLSRNRLSRITAKDLEGLTALTELGLADNLIEKLEAAAFSGCEYLNNVDLRGNRLSALPADLFLGVRSLQTLYLAENDFKEIPKAAFQGLQHLSILNLNDNQLTTLTSYSFSSMSKLSELHLSGCKIRKIESNSFAKLSSLSALDLSNNELEELPDGEFEKHLHGLKELRAGLNKMTQLRGLNSLSQLRTFVLRGCVQNLPLVLRDDTFAGNLKLEEANITQCSGLEAVPGDTFGQLPFLRILNLRGNSIDVLYPEMADWNVVEHADFSGNPLECNCEMRWLNRLAQETDVVRSGAVCFSPESLRGRIIGEITKEEYSSLCGSSSNEEKNFNLALILPLTILGVLLIAGLAVYFWRRRRKKKAEKDGTELKRASVKSYKYRWRGARRRPGGEKSIKKGDIKVIPVNLPSANDSDRFITIVSAEKEYEVGHMNSPVRGYEGHVYEELPLRPQDAKNFPDVKVSVI